MMCGIVIVRNATHVKRSECDVYIYVLGYWSSVYLLLQSLIPRFIELLLGV